MDRPETFFEAFFITIKKAFVFESGGLALLSFLFSFPTGKIFSTIFNGVEEKDLYTPFFVHLILTAVYFIVWFIDFYTGLSASRKEYYEKNGHTKGYYQSNRAWSSIWKFSGVIIITFVMLVLTFCFVITGIKSLSSISLFLMIFFFVLSILNDFHSIGENHERRFKTKPGIYNVVKVLSQVTKEAIINKIKNFDK